MFVTKASHTVIVDFDCGQHSDSKACFSSEVEYGTCTCI